MNFLFPFFGGRILACLIGIRIPNPDPLTQLNPDPIRIRNTDLGYGENFFCEEGPLSSRYNILGSVKSSTMGKKALSVPGTPLNSVSRYRHCPFNIRILRDEKFILGFARNQTLLMHTIFRIHIILGSWIWIRLRVNSRIRIRIEVKSRIRIRVQIFEMRGLKMEQWFARDAHSEGVEAQNRGGFCGPVVANSRQKGSRSTP
jgi:hypothetical protein